MSSNNEENPVDVKKSNNGEDPIKFFTRTMWNAGKIFFIAIIFSIALSVLAVWFDSNDHQFLEDITNKLSDAFSTVAAAGLSGAMFLVLNYYRDGCS